MHNVIILGTGRSGTSMVASLFRHTGAYMGEELLASTPANPYGYYEAREINRINNRLITLMLHWGSIEPCRRWFAPAAHIDTEAFWTAAPAWTRQFEPPPWLRSQMEACLTHRPFCFKDPRFSVTWPTWRPLLPADTRFLVVFRDPDRTVDSMLRDAHESYDPPLAITRRWCYRSWLRTYRRLLRDFSQQGQWLFVEYGQVLRGEALPALGAFADVTLDDRQIDPSVSRSKPRPAAEVPEAAACHRLYVELCRRADQDIRARRSRPSCRAA